MATGFQVWNLNNSAEKIKSLYCLQSHAPSIYNYYFHRTRPANFDVEWGVADDSKLLAGIYQYGMGSWEAIKMDSSFEIGDKILTNEDKKPQAKHLQSRAEYLLKVIKKLLDQKNGKQKQKKPRTKRGNKEPVTKDIVEDDGSSADENKKSNKTGKNDKTDKVCTLFALRNLCCII